MLMVSFGIVSYPSNMQGSLVLEELDDLLQVSQADAVLGVANVHLLTQSTKLGSEARLSSQAEALDNGAVGGGEELGPDAVEMLSGRQLLRDADTKRHLGPGDARQRVLDEHLDGAVDGSGEVQSPLDLPAVAGGQLGQHHHGVDLAVLLGGEVAAVLLVDPGPHLGQVDLLALAVGLPGLDALVGAPDKVLVGLDLVDLDALTLDSAGLGAAGRALVAGGVDALLLRARQGSPAEVVGQDLLHIVRDEHPDGGQAELGHDVLDKVRDNVLVLRLVAERVAGDHGKLLLPDKAHGGASLVSPNLESLVQPRGVGGIAVVGNELLDRRSVERGIGLRGVGLGMGQAGLAVGERLGVAVEERGVSHVSQLEHPGHDTLEAQTGAGMGRRAEVEAGQVLLHALLGNAGGRHVGAQLGGIVDTLATGANLLAANEDVERPGPSRILGVLVGIEGTSACREAVQDVVVGVVLLTDELTQPNLIRRRQVLLGHVTAVVSKHLKSVSEVENQRLVQILELLAGPSLLEDLDLWHGVDGREDVLEELVKELNDLVVVMLNGHFEIQARVLDATKVGRDGHLLGELGALGQEGLAAKVVDLEHGGTALGGGRLKLGGVDLYKAILLESVPELAGDHGSDAEQGLVGRVSQIEDARLHAAAQSLGRLVDAEGCVLRRVDEPQAVNVNLGVGDSGRSDGLRRLLEHAVDLNQGLGRELLHPLNHVHVLPREDTLDREGLVAEEKEVEGLGELALGVYAAAEGDLGADGQLVQLGNGVELIGSEPLLRTLSNEAPELSMLDRGEPWADLRPPPSFMVARIWRVASLWTAGARGELGMDSDDAWGVADGGVAFIVYWW
ncbi:hypothetical protein CCMA1212_008992 [Trichoderma ghanense]|uniref:Uncharacterized protein n=1 Tax=Trichoderma ghanense TaxID=65468 RepID=A0ABY2GTY6_9HYPO